MLSCCSILTGAKSKTTPATSALVQGLMVSPPALELLDDEPASNAEVNFYFFLVPVFEKNQEEIKNLEKKLMESNDIGAQIRKELEALETHVDGVVLFLFLCPEVHL